MKYAIDTYTAEEFDMMLRAINPKTPSGCRNRALLAVLNGSGLRVTELLSLLPRDVTGDGTVNVRNGKGDKQRICGLEVSALEFLRTWLDKRASLGVNGKSPIFCRIKHGLGEPMDRRTVYGWMQRLKSKADISKRLHPHAFRHTHAKRKAEDGVDLNLLRRQLGHTSLNVTQRYIDHVSAKDVVEAIQGQPKTARIVVDGVEYDAVLTPHRGS